MLFVSFRVRVSKDLRKVACFSCRALEVLNCWRRGTLRLWRISANIGIGGALALMFGLLFDVLGAELAVRFLEICICVRHAQTIASALSPKLKANRRPTDKILCVA